MHPFHSIPTSISRFLFVVAVKHQSKQLASPSYQQQESRRLPQMKLLEVVGKNGALHVVENELDVGRVGGGGEMGVDAVLLLQK